MKQTQRHIDFKFLASFSVLALFIGLPIMLYVAQQRQDPRQRAQTISAIQQTPIYQQSYNSCGCTQEQITSGFYCYYGRCTKQCGVTSKSTCPAEYACQYNTCKALDIQPTVSLTSPAPSKTTSLMYSLRLHGIGLGGDNSNPNSPGNTQPRRTNRSVTVELFTPDEKLIETLQTTALYDPVSKIFTGTTTIPQEVPSGRYIVKIKSKYFLRRRIPGIRTITAGISNQLPQATLISGDSNNDNTLSVIDYTLLISCYSNNTPPRACDEVKKQDTDLTDDGKVDQADYNLFVREMSTPNGD